MEQTTKTVPTDLVFEQKLSGLQTLSAKYKDWQDRASRAKIVLSAITEVETEEQKAEALTQLGRVAATYELINKQRLEETKPIDELKTLAMEPEKSISTQAAHKDSEYLRVKTLVTTYDNKMLKAAQKKAQEALDIKNLTEEKARLNAHFDLNFHNAVLLQVSAVDQSLATYFSTIALENFEAKEAQLKVKPTLKKEIFEGWFAVQYDKSKMSPEQFTEYMNSIREKYTLETVSTEYVSKAQVVIDKWIAKLPEKKEELNQVAALAAIDPMAAANLATEQQAKADQEKQQSAQQVQTAIENKQEEVSATHRNEVMNASFNMQVQVQSIAQPVATRYKQVATITSANNEIVQTFSKILYACFTSPKFQTHIKKDKEGNPLPPDEFGRPIYTDWAETLLDFYAENCVHNIDGVIVEKRATTVVKKK